MSAPVADQPDVLVLGAGLAGLAAAVQLAAEGASVKVVETSKRPGGRASSFDDAATGHLLDDGQHVVMGCCTHMRDFLDRLGLNNAIEWHRSLYFSDPQGKLHSLTASRLPAPFHLLPPFLRWGVLSWRQRFSVIHAMRQIAALDERQTRALDTTAFGDWLSQHRQNTVTLQRFWQPIVVSACNASIDAVSARYAITVFQRGFLHSREGYQLGVPRLPLRSLHEPACRYIERSGGQVRFGEAVRSISATHQGIETVISSKQCYRPRFVISALPATRLTRVIDDELAEHDARFNQLDQFKYTPIVAVHLFLHCLEGEPLLRLPHVAMVDHPVDWLFNKGELRDKAARPLQHVHAVISAADQWIDAAQSRLTELGLDALSRAIGKAVSNHLCQARVVKSHRATFAAEVGVDALRPSVRGATERLYLAGDWVDTDWPATMEGAVRSGEAAAAAALADGAAGGVCRETQ